MYGIIEESGSDRGFLDQLIGKSLKGCEVSVFGAGNYMRDYLHIDDLIECLLVCLDVKFEERFLPINIGTGTGTTIRNAIELVDKISRKFDGNGLSCKLEEFPSTSLKIETRSNYVDSNEVFSILGWKSKITLTEGVERTFQKIVDSQQKLVK